jgi:OTU domain-containing protein 4
MLEKRPFATGSKPGPDEIDHYLEEKGYYRKHVARDSSSLFRVIAEHVLDIQNFHDRVRQTCATYMEHHRKQYAPEVDQNFFNYIAMLRKTRTPGTLLELRVLAQLYR